MRLRTLSILAVIVGALLALIFFAEHRVASTDERAAAAKRLVTAKPDDIVALGLEWQGNRVRFERAAPAPEGEKPGAAGREPFPAPAPRLWHIVAPFEKLADGASVDRLLSGLTGLEAVRELEGAARGDVGLDPPRGSVTWKTAAAEGRLEIGGSIPATSDMVVAASGRRALAVASDGLVADLSRPAGEWRSREVVAATRDRIERVSISGSGAGTPVVLDRSGETLRLASPIEDLVDRDLADRLLSDLAALRMETFLDPPLSPEVEKALAERLGTIELTLSGEPAPMGIDVGGEVASGKRVWRAGDQVFETASALSSVVARPPGEWRSRNWTRFENWRIEKARVEEAGGTFELVRSDGEWLRDGKKIPFTAAGDLLYALTSARAERLIEKLATESTPAPSPPTLTVTLSDGDGNEEVLTLLAGGDPAAAVSPALTRGRSVMLLLPREKVTELEKKIAAVRAAEPVADASPAP